MLNVWNLLPWECDWECIGNRCHAGCDRPLPLGVHGGAQGPPWRFLVRKGFHEQTCPKQVLGQVIRLYVWILTCAMCRLQPVLRALRPLSPKHSECTLCVASGLSFVSTPSHHVSLSATLAFSRKCVFECLGCNVIIACATFQSAPIKTAFAAFTWGEARLICATHLCHEHK